MGIKTKFKSWFFLNDDYDEEYEEEYLPQNVTQEIKESPRVSHKQNVISLQSVQKSAKLILLEPRTYSDAQVIADHLISHRTVVVNLQRMDQNDARRIVDFLSGTVYAISGDIQRIGKDIFVCAPENVEISGTISEAFANGDLDDMRW